VSKKANTIVRTKLFDYPLRCAATVTGLGAKVGLYAFAIDTDRKDALVAVIYGGFKTHVVAMWAHMMGGKSDLSFWSSGHGRLNLRRGPDSKGLYTFSDFLLPSGTIARFLRMRTTTPEGCLLHVAGQEWVYFIASQGDNAEEINAKRFALFLRSSVLIAIKHEPIWYQDLFVIGKRQRLVRQVASEGMTVYAVSTNGEAWRESIEDGCRRGFFGNSGGF